MRYFSRRGTQADEAPVLHHTKALKRMPAFICIAHAHIHIYKYTLHHAKAIKKIDKKSFLENCKKVVDNGDHLWYNGLVSQGGTDTRPQKRF